VAHVLTRPIPLLQATLPAPLAAVSVVSRICRPRPKHAANAHLRGSAFLKQWMEYLEEHADLRYPNLADVYTGAE
jgi:hypothetical protein